MDRCTGRRDITEIRLNTAFTIQSINQSIKQHLERSLLLSANGAICNESKSLEVLLSFDTKPTQALKNSLPSLVTSRPISYLHQTSFVYQWGLHFELPITWS